MFFCIIHRLGNSATTDLFASRGHMFESVSYKYVIGVNVSKVTKTAQISLNRVKNVYLLDFKFVLFKVYSCADLLHIA